MFLRKFIILFSLIITGSAFSGQFDAKVIKVIDGDTIWVKTENKHVKIRLSYIDAPELRQTFGVRSKNYLTNLVLDKKVQIDTYRKDRYNRIIGEVYIHDDKGSILSFNKDSKLLWKANNYSKDEKKIGPLLSMIKKNNRLVVSDNLANTYVLDINNGKTSESELLLNL